MVITDARLGGMSGYEFLKTVAEKRPELPVIMITAYATPETGRRGHQVGSD